MIIAVDGPAASGKGTIARRLAEHFDFHHLDTGLLYRAVAYLMLEQDLDLEDADAAAQIAGNLDISRLDPEDLKQRGVGEAASRIAVHKQVRAALFDLQKSFAKKKPGVVLDGRDIGSVICPDADVKFFITAHVEERSRRRALEWQSKGNDVDFETVLKELKLRDERDRERNVAPLTKDDEAHLLDTTNLSIEEAFQAAVALINRA